MERTRAGFIVVLGSLVAIPACSAPEGVARPGTPHAESPGVVLEATHGSEAAAAQQSDRTPRTVVILDRAGPDIFPESWRTPRIDASAEPLEPQQRARALEIVSGAMAKYPKDLLDERLRAVYVMGRLRYSGIAAGGTNSREAVYLVVDRTFSGTDIERIFHAELSSVLLRGYRTSFDEAAWRAVNPPEFCYEGTGGVQAIRDRKASLKGDATMLERGFLHEYGMYDLENDFNSYAGALFMGDPGLWSAMDAHPRVAAKAELVIAFYGAIDPGIDRARFLSLRARAARP